MLACPFHIPRYEWDKTIPFMAKCDMCYDRLALGQLPACVEACPEKALLFGSRQDMIHQARAMIQKKPQHYLNHIWGEKEFGGTSVMYISDVDLAALGWPDAEAKAIPALTEPLVHKTPFIGLGVAVGLVGLNWIVKRRNELATNCNDNTRTKKEEHD